MAKVTVTLKTGKQYWVFGKAYYVDKPVVLDDKKDKRDVEYISKLENFTVESAKAPATDPAPEAPKE